MGQAEKIILRPAFPPPNICAVTKLSLTDFRGYAGLRLELSTESVVLTGANGAGKTNMLEALSLLSPGRGLRRAKLCEMGRLDATSGFAVAARLATRDGCLEVGTGFVPAGSDGVERRQVRIDGVNVSGPQALADIATVTWLTPQMDRLFIESASGRRRFLDRLTYSLDPAHSGRVNAYEKAMRERNRLLKSGDGEPSWFTALEQTMAEWGTAVAAARREMLARLTAALAEGIEAPFPSAGLRVEGRLENWLDEMPALAVEDRFRALLAESRRLDLAAGITLDGPHRSDLCVHHLDRDMPAALCSTGEQKGLLVAITLAHARLLSARRGLVPMLLLDEIAAHLDRARREALFRLLKMLGAQVWMTGTDRYLFDSIHGEAQFFTVREGRVFS